LLFHNQRQRYQFKLKAEKKASTLTAERIVALDDIGFIWDSHGSAWMERWNELQEFRHAFGHCNVPTNYPANIQLATWLKCQRRQYKLFKEGKTSNMTEHRLQKLERLGLEWELRVHTTNFAKSNYAENKQVLFSRRPKQK
jgi:hypothetical protein